MLEPLTEDDLSQIATLHVSSLEKGFLSFLGQEFLILVYTQVYQSSGSFIFVHRDRGQIVGFVSGGTGLKEVYLGLLKTPFKLFSTLCWRLFKPRVLLQVLFILLRKQTTKQSTFNNIDAELYSIAVHNAYRGLDVGTNLYRMLCKRFAELGFSEFKIVVGNELKEAKNFYTKQGAIEFMTLNQGANKRSIVYRQSLKHT